jgi:AraC-like DNA-binding protein
VSGSDQANLLTLLSARSAAMVEQAAPSGVRAFNAPDATAFVKLQRSPQWRAIVVDPTALSAEAVSYVAMHASEATQGLLLLAPTTSLAARRIVIAAHHAPVHVVFVDCESTDRLLAIEMRRLGGRSVRALLLSSLTDAVDVLPPSICAGVVALFGILPLPRSSGTFARRVGCSRRTVDRWARRAGFRGAASLLRSVRLAWAWEMSQARGFDSSKQVSTECGYGSARTFSAHSRRVLGLAPAKLVGTPFERGLIERLGRAALGPSRRSPRPAREATAYR